MEEATWETKV